MARYVDAENLEAYFNKRAKLNELAGDWSGAQFFYNMKEIIERQPTIDLLATIKCKNCKHSYVIYGEYFLGCNKHQVSNLDLNFYCKDGEIREVKDESEI